MRSLSVARKIRRSACLAKLSTTGRAALAGIAFSSAMRGGRHRRESLRIGGYRLALEKVLRPNASVILTLTQLKHPFATLF
jgi:hypothetical protein